MVPSCIEIIAFLVVFCPALSIFYDFCLEKGNIFYGFNKYITFFLWFQLKRRGVKYPIFTPTHKRSRIKIALFKLIGGCVFCSNPYQVFLICLGAGIYFCELQQWIILGMISIPFNHILLRIWYSVFKPTA